MNRFSTQKDLEYLKVLAQMGIEPDNYTKEPTSQCSHFKSMLQNFESTLSISNSKEINEQLLKGIPRSQEYIANSNLWMSAFELMTFIANVHQFLPSRTIYDWIPTGQSFLHTTKLWSTYNNLVSIEEAFKKIQDKNKRNNKYTELTEHKITKKSAHFKMHYKNVVNQISVGIAPHYFIGVLSIPPLTKGFTKCTTQVPINQMQLENIIKIAYRQSKLNTRFDSKGNLFANDTQISEQIALHELKEQDELVTQWVDENPNTDYLVNLIINPLTKNGITFLKENEAFNAPFSSLQLSWSNMDYKKKVRSMTSFSGARNEQIEMMHQLLAELDSHREQQIAHEELIRKKGMQGQGQLLKDVVHFFHNINNLLTASLGGAELAQEDLEDLKTQLPQENQKLITSISENQELSLSSTKRLDTMLKQKFRMLLEQSKQEYEMLDINKLVKITYESHQYDCRKNSIETRLTLQDIPLLQGSSSDLCQIINELMVNAQKAIKDSSKKAIYVSTYSQSRYSCIEVTDTGYGIEARDIDKLFDPKTIIHKDREGSHQGLEYMLTTVEQYGGHIEIESPGKDKGTTFKVLFPQNSIH